MVLLAFIQIVCVVIGDSHLFEFLIDNNLALKHCSDKNVSRFDLFLEMIVLFNLEIKQSDLLLLTFVVESAEMLHLPKRKHSPLKNFLYFIFNAIKCLSELDSCILSVQNKHR